MRTRAFVGGTLHFGLIIIRRILDITLVLASATLVIRFGLQYHHPWKWDALAPVVALHRWVDPIVSDVNAWLGFSWPSSDRFLPIGLALLLLLTRAVIYNCFEWILQGIR